MSGVQDWAEVHRLHHREGVSQAAIASRLGMSRNTVARLLSLKEPPRYQRRLVGVEAGPVQRRGRGDAAGGSEGPRDGGVPTVAS